MNFKNLTKQEMADIIERCHFTRKEQKVFDYRCEGITIEEISVEMDCTSRTVDRVLREIKRKISEL